MANETQQSSDDILAEDPGLILGAQYSTDFDVSLPRPKRIVFEPIATQKGTIYRRTDNYVGPNRIDSKNRFVLNPAGQPYGPYDERRDSRNELYKLDDVDRLATLKQVQKALGGRYTPSKTGLSDTDFNAFELVLRQANAMGRTWDVALNQLMSMPASMEGGTGRSYRLTSSDDIRNVAQETAIKLLGRGLEPAAMKRIIKAIQQEDVRSQQPGTRETAPTLGTSVQQQVMKQDPQEAMMQGAATIGELLTQALGGD